MTDLRGAIARRAAAVTGPIHVSRSGIVTRGNLAIGYLTRQGRQWEATHADGRVGTFERQSDAAVAVNRFDRDGTFDWSKFTYGEYDVPTEALYALRQHDDINSGKHPNLLEDVRQHGITEPVEVSLHDDERGVVLRGGSHRVNAAMALGIKTMKVRVIDMRSRG